MVLDRNSLEILNTVDLTHIERRQFLMRAKRVMYLVETEQRDPGRIELHKFMDGDGRLRHYGTMRYA